MTAPNLDTVAASLRSCSLGGGGGEDGGDRSSPPYLAEVSDETAGAIAVDLNSDTGRPYNWEQRLDMRTGDVYYINWETGMKTTEDPRTSAASASSVYSSSYYSDEDNWSSDEYSYASHVGIGEYYGDVDNEYEEDGINFNSEYEEDGIDSADSSSLPSACSPQTDTAEESASGDSGHVLVAAGCKSCFMYFMIPKCVNSCPKCGDRLLHLGRNGCV